MALTPLQPLLYACCAGTNSIQSILSTVIFNIGPQIFDIAAACVYLATALQPWIAVIVFVTLISYIPVTIYFTEWRGNFRRWAHEFALTAPLQQQFFTCCAQHMLHCFPVRPVY